MDALLRIELLGGLRVAQGDRIVSRFRTQKIASLFAYLAYHSSQAHPREALIDLLWPELSRDDGRNNLSYSLSSLRRQLEPPGVARGAILACDRLHVRLDEAHATTDVREFRSAIEAAAAARDGTRIRCLDRAAALYAGDLLPGHYQEWVLGARDTLRNLYLRALHELAVSLERSEPRRAVEYAGRAVRADALREEAYRDLMRAHARLGERAEALRVYRELERALEGELGVRPEPATLTLLGKIERSSGSVAAVAPQAAGAASSRVPRASDGALAGVMSFLAAERLPAAGLPEPLRKLALESEGRELERSEGGVVFAFARATDAITCAVALERAGAFALGLAVHTGEVAEGATPSAAIEHALRISAAASSGQILLSEAAAQLARSAAGGPDAGAQAAREHFQVADLGLFRLLGADAPERLFSVVHAGAPAAARAPPMARAVRTGRLPPRLTKFVGREVELARVCAMLTPEDQDVEPARLVTLHGPGGIGKTRLATEAAARVFERFHGAVFFVPLADVEDPRWMPDAILSAMLLERHAGRAPIDEIVEAISSDRALLILDNLEQLISERGPAGEPAPATAADAASIVASLVERAPRLSCLVTSRRCLGLSGEREVVLDPLPLPEGTEAPEALATSPSVALFLDRAQAARSDFQVTGANAGAIAEICRRLEGIPLALELAAGRAQLMTPREMQGHLDERLDAFSSRKRDAAARHRTLRAAIDWSYRLLAPVEQRFFALLSVFRGSFELEAVRAVTDEPRARDLLEELRDCSLIRAEEGSSGTRFHLLETIREYAAEQLSSEDRALARRRHLEHYCALAERGREALTGAEQGSWLSRFDEEHENVRAALDGAREDRSAGERAIRLAFSLYRFWHIRGHWTEARKRLDELLAQNLDATPVRARGVWAAGCFAILQGDHGVARARFEEALGLARSLGDRNATAKALEGLGRAVALEGNSARARAHFEEALAIDRELDNQGATQVILNNLAVVCALEGDLGRARELLEESLALKRRRGDRAAMSATLASLATLHEQSGAYAAAHVVLRECRELCREFGEPEVLCSVLRVQGAVRWHEGDPAAARPLFEEALAVARKVGSKRGVGEALRNLGWLALRLGEHAAARKSLEQGLELLREVGDAQAVAVAIRSLGELAWRDGDPGAARGLYEESLRRLRKVDRLEIAPSLELLAALDGTAGRAERSARLVAAAASLREATGTPVPACDRAEHERLLSDLRSTLGEEAYARAFSTGRSLRADEAIALALSG